MKILSLYSVLLLSLVSLNSVGSPNGAALNALVDRLAAIETIEGQFVQYVVDQKGTRLQETKGAFKARRPGMFYWATKEPLEQYIYANNDEVTIYDPDLEQATVQRVNKQVQATPALLFSGDITAIGNQFDVEQRDFEGVAVQFLLTPKQGDSLFERLLIRFEGKQLVEMRLSDSLGQESTVHFVETQVNNEIGDQAFEASFPEGTDVIRDLPVQNVQDAG